MNRNVTEIKDKLAYSVEEMIALTSLSRSFLKSEIKKGNLKAQKFGGRVLVTRENWNAYVESRPEWKPKNERQK